MAYIAPKYPISNCGKANCRLFISNANGSDECLMDSVRDKWNDPVAKNYCVDPSCKKFVDLFNRSGRLA